MSSPSFTLRRIDTRRPNWQDELTDLRNRLSPRGNIVSAAGRQRTIDVFGAPLTPQQVVERICSEVQAQGTPAVLSYSSKLDRAELDENSLRVPAAELAAAHAQATPEFLETIRRIRDNIWRFQTAILHHDVTVEPSQGVVLK
ncbi:MAG: histidinol dehydrogenase, partial [Planctomycetales bacterium]|nr:histidinol dehydrogenase [Planctomycetales bacterium]